MRIGIHREGGNNLYNAVVEAGRAGHDCVQAFISTPMRLFNGSPSFLKDVRLAVRDSGVTLIIHGPFVYNLATEDNTKFKQAFGMLKKLMDSASEAGATYVVNHVGTGSLDRVHEICEYIISRGYSAKLLLENDSGSKAGTRTGSLTNIRELLRRMPELGWAFDTAHAFADGFDVASKGAKLVRLMKPSVIHLNEPDLKVVPGGHLDRHNSVFGTGQLGIETLADVASAASEIGAHMVIESDKAVAMESLNVLRSYKDYCNMITQEATNG